MTSRISFDREIYPLFEKYQRENPKSSLGKSLLKRYYLNWNNPSQVKKTIENFLGRYFILLYRSFDDYNYNNSIVYKYDSIIDYNDKKNIVQEHLYNPILYHGKRFLMKVILDISNENNYKSIQLDMIPIFLAQEKYFPNDYSNPNIFRILDPNQNMSRITFPKTFLEEKILTPRQVLDIQNQIKVLGLEIRKVINNNKNKYKYRNFKTICLELLVDNDYQIYLWNLDFFYQKHNFRLEKYQKPLELKPNTQQKFYYLFKSRWIKTPVVLDLFNSRGCWEEFDEKNPQKKYPDFIYTDALFHFYGYTWKYKTYLKFGVDEKKHVISHKDQLYENCYKLIKKYQSQNKPITLDNYLMEQHQFDWMEITKKKQVTKALNKIKECFERKTHWIYKPVGGFRGMGIKIYNDYLEFEKDFKMYLEEFTPRWRNATSKTSILYLNHQYVLQEYIIKPYLFENKKFHIRPIFLYHRGPNIKEGYILNKCLVAHAYEDYQPRDFFRTEIHDTHFSSTSRRIFFPDDFIRLKIMTEKEAMTIFNQLIDIGKYLFEILDAKCYSESNYCYEPFGMDTMVEHTLMPKIIEVQMTNLSMGLFKDDDPTDPDLFINYYYRNLMEVVVDKHFPPKETFQKENLKGFIRIY
jgi:hypothetical protein